MKQLFSILVFLFIAIPFVYMLFDVSLDISRRILTFFSAKRFLLPNDLRRLFRLCQSPNGKKFGFPQSRAYLAKVRRFNES